ncbi:MAG TPA: histidine kinase [Lacunisphaera sp.]
MLRPEPVWGKPGRGVNPALRLAARAPQARPAAAELDRLQWQVQPHFLGNALNSISALVRLQQNDQALRALTQLGQMHRIMLENTATLFVPLAREIGFIEYYLDLERLRFGERLQATIEVDPGAEVCPVPNLLLQPLVENAVRHGVARRTGASRVVLRVTRGHDRLHVVVRNDPAAESEPVAAGSGFGLRSVHRRLLGLYGDDARFAYIPDHPEGFTVTLEIPL